MRRVEELTKNAEEVWGLGVWVGLLAVDAGGRRQVAVLRPLLEKTDGKFAARQVLFFAAAKTYLHSIMYEQILCVDE